MRHAQRKPWVSRFLLVVRSYSTIHTSNSFFQSAQLILANKNKIAIKDIDETLMLSTGYASTAKKSGLGSSFWFMSVMNMKQIPPQAILAYYFAIQEHINHIPTEDCVPEALSALEKSNIPILGLTTRSAAISDITIKNCEKHGIRFTAEARLTRYHHKPVVLDLPKKEGESDAIYYRGVIFCGGHPKDICFDAFLKTSVGAEIFSGVKHVSFMDDQPKHCESMHNYLKGKGFFPTVINYIHIEKNIPCATKEEIEEDMYQLARDKGVVPLGNRW